jgi:hypothetical protein
MCREELDPHVLFEREQVCFLVGARVAEDAGVAVGSDPIIA